MGVKPPRRIGKGLFGGHQSRRNVRFSPPKKGRRVVQEPNVRFLGGPRAAARRHPAGKSFRFAQVQGRHEFDQEGFSLLLNEVLAEHSRQLPVAMGLVVTLLQTKG